MKCPTCDVTWSEYDPSGSGRCRWSCGVEIPLPEPRPVHRAYVFPSDVDKARAGGTRLNELSTVGRREERP